MGGYLRVIKDNGAIVLFSDEPFTSQLVNSNIKLFKYKWIWDKQRGSNFQVEIFEMKHQGAKNYWMNTNYDKETYKGFKEPIMSFRKIK